MDIFLIDAIGPFFRGLHKKRINWSKIPFQHLDLEPEKRRSQFDQIRVDLDQFAQKVSTTGYNSVTLDDVAHLAPDIWYEPEINNKIAVFQEEYQLFFAVLQHHGLSIYLTMDILSFTPALRQAIGTSFAKGIEFCRRQIDTVFNNFPELSGIILRIGECDGNDVQGDFKSELFLRRSSQLNRLLRELLPIFEQQGKYLILRNWTVGAYQIGDFLWHRQTTARVLDSIDSPNFILSMKYGESDFFRYLPLNKNFFRFPKIKKILELQARREYEGCGEFPSFIGWDYEQYARDLSNIENIAGISVWCQTGGWLPFRRITYLEPQGIWNELNSYVTIKLFREGWSVEQAITEFAGQMGCTNSDGFLELLRLDDQVIKELLYIRDIAELKTFFRRVRIPPLLTVYWNNIFINHSVRSVLLCYVTNPEQTIAEGFAALTKISRMKELAPQVDLAEEDFDYMEDTFKILALARQYFFQPNNAEIRRHIKEAKQQYKKKYPKDVRPRYRIKTNYAPFPMKMHQLRMLFRLTLRHKRGYRLIDYLFTLHLLGFLFRMVVYFRPGIIPEFAKKQAMGIDTLFR